MERFCISCMQRIVVYETKARYYVVGSNNTESRFRVLKIDRQESRDLVLHDDGLEYTHREIRNLLHMIDSGNRPKEGSKGVVAGLHRAVSAFGIVGFVRFLEGYYMVLITKRRKVAIIGHHTIYKIEDTSMVYIPNERPSHPDESKYVKMFQANDLSSNFYFSYSYDLTHTLQYNLTPSKNLENHFMQENIEEKERKFSVLKPSKYVPESTGEEVEDADTYVPDVQELEIGDTSDDCTSGEDGDANGDSARKKEENNNKTASSQVEDDLVYGVRNEPEDKYVWNSYLLKDFKTQANSDWILYLIHGFIGQMDVIVYGRNIYLTVIARRSTRMAGTRFLKRGVNCMGEVANEVETEQIVHDSTILDLRRARISSFVQLRGSIPLFWSHDLSKVMPKPPIQIDHTDPYGTAPGQHFNKLLRRYGAPIIILNLVKTRENKKRESLISEEFIRVIKYLNQFLPPEHAIEHIGFDMARANKKKNANVMHDLGKIAQWCVRKNGIFSSKPDFHCHQWSQDFRWKSLQGYRDEQGMRQTGVVRTNCVDCLDRTNTAQFAIGKCALAYQISLKCRTTSLLDFVSNGRSHIYLLKQSKSKGIEGKQIVIRSHKSDERINSYFEYYRPFELTRLDDLFAFHMPDSIRNFMPKTNQNFSPFAVRVAPSRRYVYKKNLELVYCTFLLSCGQNSYNVNIYSFGKIKFKSCESLICATASTSTTFLSLHAVFAWYLCCRLALSYQNRHSSKNSSLTRQESSVLIQSTAIDPNPNISGKDSTMSTQSSDSEEDGEEASIEGDVESSDSDESIGMASKSKYISFQSIFPTMEETYGVEITDLTKTDKSVYKRYVQIGENASNNLDYEDGARASTTLIRRSIFTLDSSKEVTPPCISRYSREVYTNCVRVGKEGAQTPSIASLKKYQEYVSFLYR
ncbi:polyphosphoinositide phosphatase [Lingula anatina]|uniref:Polyphosphoinositide phosphatase n=1 Tax=Lingula anatina TaxID=7574 RepID=A0A2R2MQF6_LINAN|nr:polyphosphoinositide phosphatase [Lingula anatina]|eukprot:XP_023932242.1 polyphosphoinositide phosphatase [Lingula anatina]